jgi:acyl-coenzyme A synthetase/AMP-(fatty) acid ligase
MLGYAENRADLGKGDELNGRLRTGDIARRDEDGYYYIVGRLKRFLKLFGKRFSLDEMEELIGRRVGHPVACFGADDQLRVAIESSASEPATAQVLRDMLKINASAVRILKLDPLPRLANGKLDYQSLARWERL